MKAGFESFNVLKISAISISAISILTSIDGFLEISNN